MAYNYFLGTAVAVAQISKCQVGGTLAGEDFEISVGGLVIASHTDTTTVIGDTVAALVNDWNNGALKDHPYAKYITATDADPYVVLTVDTAYAGVPFTVTLNTPGGAATFALTTPTASAGPNHVDDDTNWSLEHKLAATEDGVVANTKVALKWGLDQITGAIASFTQRRTHEGPIGLDFATFDGNAAAVEYRPCYLELNIAAGGKVKIGEHVHGPGNPSGSRRVLIDTGTAPCDIEMLGSASTSLDSGRPAVRVLTNHASTDIHVRSAPAGFGIACDKPGETSLFNEMTVSCPELTHKVFVGEGCEWTLFETSGGYSIVHATGTTSESLKVDGGIVRTEGLWLLTTLQVGEAGKVFPNHANGNNPCITTVDLNRGGTIDVRMSNENRIWSTLNWKHQTSTLELTSAVDVTTANLLNDGGLAGV